MEELTGRSSAKFVSASKTLSTSLETDNVTLEHIQSFITETDFLVHAPQTNPDPNEGNKASSNGVLIGTMIGLVVIIAIAVYYFVFMKKDDPSSPDSVEEAKP